MIIVEAGINHFGSVKEANMMLSHFLSSKADSITFQIQSKKFIEKYKKLKINFELPHSFYKKAIEKVKKKKKKIGLAVCDLETANKLDKLKFDFYKLLSVSIKNKKLIQYLKHKNKSIYISTGVAKNVDIKNCLQLLSKKKSILLHTPMSYQSIDLNLDRISYLKEKFNINVGYSHHFNSKLPILLAKALKYQCFFIYFKLKKLKGRVYPDDKHAIYYNEIDDLIKKIKLIDEMIGNKMNINSQIKISFDGIKIK